MQRVRDQVNDLAMSLGSLLGNVEKNKAFIAMMAQVCVWRGGGGGRGGAQHGCMYGCARWM